MPEVIEPEDEGQERVPVQQAEQQKPVEVLERKFTDSIPNPKVLALVRKGVKLLDRMGEEDKTVLKEAIECFRGAADLALEQAQKDMYPQTRAEMWLHDSFIKAFEETGIDPNRHADLEGLATAFTNRALGLSDTDPSFFLDTMEYRIKRAAMQR